MEEDNIASAETLLRMAQGGQRRTLPEAGQKLSEPPPPEDGWLAAEHERTRTEELFTLLAEPLVAKRSDLVTAAWLPEEDRAELSAPPGGKFWQYMGYELRRRKFLRWEEAVMLCELGAIQLTSDGQPCSLQEVRARVLASDPVRERQYRLYAYLTRQGYRPVRYGQPTGYQHCATDYERKIRLDQYIADRKSKRHRAGSRGSASPEPKLPRGDATSGGASEPREAAEETAESEQGVSSMDESFTDADARTDGVESSAAAPRAGGDATYTADASAADPAPQEAAAAPRAGGDELGPTLKRLDFSAERRLFPRVLPGAGVVTLQAPPPELLPPGVQTRNQYCVDVAAVRRGRRSERTDKDRPRDRYPSCLPVLNAPARNWTEFKQQAEALAASAIPVTSADTSDSLVPPGWRGSPAELLARLRLAPDTAPASVPGQDKTKDQASVADQTPTPDQIATSDRDQDQVQVPDQTQGQTTTQGHAPGETPIPDQAPNQTTSPDQAPDQTTTPDETKTLDHVPEPEPVFDVFPSDAPYRKSAPPLPEFRVFIARPEQLVAELATAPAADGVPLCAAVMADAGAPALYMLSPGRLPVDESVLNQTLW